MNNTYWLKSLHIGGYKSIKDLTIDFLPGLNIIIGQNGTGKSNFFEFVNKGMSMKFPADRLAFFSAELEYDKKPLHYEFHNQEIKKNGLERSQKVYNVQGKVVFEEKEYAGNKNIIVKEKEEMDLQELAGSLFLEKNIIISSLELIEYGHPLVNKEGLSWIRQNEVGGVDFYSEYTKVLAVKEFVQKYTKNNQYDVDKMREAAPELAEDLSNYFKSELAYFVKYSPIQSVRFHKEIEIIRLKDGDGGILFTNIFYEYKYNNQWYQFDDLSDGTKRIIYIIEKVLNAKIQGEIILLEEPEIGIHPHQFHLLMDFLKEAAEDCQIIISTHSPQALNVLNGEELDSIIVADMTEDGTQLRHLDDKTKAKARKYMENEDSLASFWLYSDLEKSKA